jgi:hypothetical protein
VLGAVGLYCGHLYIGDFRFDVYGSIRRYANALRYESASFCIGRQIHCAHTSARVREHDFSA